MAFTLSIYIGVLIFVLKVSEFSTAFGFENSQLINGDGHLGFALILFSVLLSPIATLLSVLTAYISRKFEFQADAYAAINHGKDDMITALKVLSKENFSNLTPHPLYVKLLYSHPPVAQRIRAIRKVD
jgi:STE24 endopeptidase